MLLVFKWGLKWEQGRYFREQPGPEGRSSHSPCCTITVRLDEDGDMENVIVCMSWWGQRKENAAPDDLCTRSRARFVCIWETYSELECVFVWCEISSCSQKSPFFSCLHKRRGSVHVFVIEANRREPVIMHSVILLNERLPQSQRHCFSAGIQLTSTIQPQSPPSQTLLLFLLLSLHPFLVPVLVRQSGLKCPSSTSNFTTRHNTQTIPLRSAWLDPFALDTSSAYWLMGLISESGGALRHQSLSGPYLFSEPVIPC